MEVYLPGEVYTKEEGGDSDDCSDDESELADISCGMKRKANSNTPNAFPTKVAKRTTQDSFSTVAMGAIDDTRPNLTLVDIPNDEDVLEHPFGRHCCLYMKIKVDASKKPNPQEAVSPLLHELACY